MDVCYAAVMTDEGYRNMVRLGKMPRTVGCHTCGQPATFKDDEFAARYECKNGHPAAAMWFDPCVVGKESA
jgi:hypothetical protein